MRKKIEDESQRRVHQINCALTKTELDVIDERRGAATRGEFLRLAALDAPPPPKIPEANLELWTRFAPMSANLNQISRRLNSGDPLNSQIEELRATVAGLRRALIEGEIPPEQPAEPEPAPQPPEQQAPVVTTGDDIKGFPKPRTFSFDQIKGGAA